MHLLGIFITAIALMASAQGSAASYAFGFPAASMIIGGYFSYPQLSLAETSSLPVDEPPAIGGSAEGIRDGIIADFNTRYGRDLEPPAITFTNETRGKYENGAIYIPYASQYAISHETCHYLQEKACNFESYGESFCEVFAGADRSKDECAEGGWPGYYCAPFRLSEVEREGFLDCVFGDACASGGASEEELMSCYNKNKK